MALKTENRANGLVALKAFKRAKMHTCKAGIDWHYEHGQLWITCTCGAAWSVVVAEGPGSFNGYGFEQVSDGED